MFVIFLLVRKLIEGEDCRLSTMVGKLSLTGSPHLTLSAASASASLSAPVGSQAWGDTDRTKPAAATDGAGVVSPVNQTDGNLQQQATEMSKRNTVLIR